jgi:hypothetical protein
MERRTEGEMKRRQEYMKRRGISRERGLGRWKWDMERLKWICVGTSCMDHLHLRKGGVSFSG